MYNRRMEPSRRDANPIWRHAIVGFIAALVALAVAIGISEIIKADHRWQANCREVLHGAVQTQTWSGYGYHTGSSGQMVYGHYSTSTTVCRLTSGPNAGVIVDTE
jgi:hypothetical protein